MAENRFKKSVDTATYNTLDNTHDNMLDNVEENRTYNIKPSILDNITKKELKSRGGNHTFYLSEEVVNELNRLAKRTKKSKSRLLNDILEAVFESGRSNE